MTNKESHPWKLFKGIGNDKAQLIKKAEVLAPFLIFICSVTTNLLDEKLKDEPFKIKMEKQKVQEVFREIILFMLYRIDRISFGILGKEKRNIFMDALVVKTAEMLARDHIDSTDTKQFEEEFRNLYNISQSEYTNYKLEPKKNEGLKGTLFWEFGKKMAKLLGAEMDAFIIMIFASTVAPLLSALYLDKLIEGKSSQ